jgi:hypothetical protein
MLRVCGGAKWGEGNMMNDFIKKAIWILEKNRSDEDLVDVIKKVLETDINLDFLLELKTRELELLTACIRDRIGQVTN